MPETLDPAQVTLLLDLCRDGDEAAAQELFETLYDELKRVAARCMQDQPATHTLQATALVHEVWMRITRGGRMEFESRAHFLRAAARAMRHVLVDHARAKKAAKRGAGKGPVPLDGLLASFTENNVDVLDLNAALEKLRAMDADLAQLVELRFFTGLSVEETASALKVSERTVHRGWRVAQLWLRDRMPG